MKGLYLITDRALSSPRSVKAIVDQAVQGGVQYVQLREKELGIREFIAAAEELRALLAPQQIPLLINDRVDVALAAGADGVHLGQRDMPYALARKLLGPEALIGLSIETFDELQAAEDLDLAYAALSPVFFTATKSDLPRAWGLTGIRRARGISRHPLVAIGGINAGNAAAVLEAGADALAVVSAICAAPAPAAAAAELRRIIDTYSEQL